MMPAGRPSEYKPGYGDEIIALMATGLSLTAAAADLGFHRDTIYEWARQHAEFSDALKLARGKRVLQLEKELLSSEVGPKVTARIFALKNADPEEWRDKHEVTGADGAPLIPETDNRDVARAILSLLRGANAPGDGG